MTGVQTCALPISRLCARAFPNCGKRGPLFITVRRPLTVVACPVAEHRLQTRRLSSCGLQAQLLRGMWDPPRPGLEPVSPALAGRPSTTAPPGKPHIWEHCEEEPKDFAKLPEGPCAQKESGPLTQNVPLSPQGCLCPTRLTAPSSLCMQGH